MTLKDDATAIYHGSRECPPSILWLLETGNPAVRHRTRSEPLGQEDDPGEAFRWIANQYPG